MEEETNEGVAYLKALKRSDDPGVAPARKIDADEHFTYSSSAAHSGERFQGAEKRRGPRYKCEGSAELREDGHDVRTWATFSEVSLHGCYVEVQATYPVGTVLHMKLEANGVRIENKGRVRVNYPYLGMGIAFLEMTDDNVSRVKELLNKLSRSTMIMGLGISSSIPSHGPLEAVPLVTDPAAAIQALIEFYADSQVLMQEDFLRILRKSQTHDSQSHDSQNDGSQIHDPRVKA
jgi:hypothetical protein